jgi:hypothetical protein
MGALLPVPLPPNAGPGTAFWFARFNERALARGLSIAADLPSVAELRADAARDRAAGNGWLADYNSSLADRLEADVRLVGLHAIVGDYHNHPDRGVVRMHAHDFRKALFAQIEAQCAPMLVAAE